jgi:hypothetical protein
MVIKTVAPLQWACQFCRSGLHRSCPGAVRTPKGLITCICAAAPDAGHPARPRCLDCGQDRPGEVDAVKWACLDQYGCSARLQARREAGPLYDLLRACRVSAVNARRRHREQYTRVGATLPEDEDALYGPPKKRSVPKARSGQCLCCGQSTKGGRFRPGHDAKLRGKLLKLIKDGDRMAMLQLQELGWGDHK